MSKISISYSSPTERMRYGADILFRTCLGVEVEWVEHVDLENEGHHFYTILSPK